MSNGCSGFSVDVTCLDRAPMSHATGELSANVHVPGTYLQWVLKHEGLGCTDTVELAHMFDAT